MIRIFGKDLASFSGPARTLGTGLVLCTAIILLAVNWIPSVVSRIGATVATVQSAGEDGSQADARDETARLDSLLLRIRGIRQAQSGGGSPSLILASVQAAGRKTGISIGDIQSSPPEPGDYAVTHRLQLKGQGRFADILRFLYLEESGAQVISVDALDLQPVDRDGQSVTFTMSIAVHVGNGGNP